MPPQLPIPSQAGLLPAAQRGVAALIWTLETGLGDAFTFEAREAWATVYWILADTKKSGAVQPLARSA